MNLEYIPLPPTLHFQVVASPDPDICKEWSGRHNAPRVCAELLTNLYQAFDNKCHLGIQLCILNHLDNEICKQHIIE